MYVPPQVRLAPSGQYEREMLASKAARRINTAEEKAIKGQYERTDTRSGHVRCVVSTVFEETCVMTRSKHHKTNRPSLP